jgi:hypothetical protein
MALESSSWQRNKRNFILFIIVGAAMLISALALKAYRSRKRFNVNPLSNFPLTIPNSNSSIPSTEVELRSSSSPREQEQGEKAVAQGQKHQVSQIGEQAVKQQSKQELQGKEQEQLRLSASLGFLPVPQKPGAQNTQQNVSAAPAPVKPALIPQAQSDWQVKLVLLALPFLYTLFFMSINRGLLGVAIIAVGVPGYGCFVATELAIKLWNSQRKFAAFFTSFAIFCLGLILFFVFFVMLPDISYLIGGK